MMVVVVVMEKLQLNTLGFGAAHTHGTAAATEAGDCSSLLQVMPLCSPLPWLWPVL